MFMRTHNRVGSATLYIDNQSAVGAAAEGDASFFSVRDANRDEADLLMEIWSAMQDENVQWNIEWVQGHQKEPTTQEGRMNVLADLLTHKAYNLPERLQTSPNSPHMGCIGWNLSIEGNLVHTNLRTRIKDHLQRDHITQYIKSKENWNDTTMSLINWEAIDRCFKHKSWMRRLSMTKFIFDWIPHNVYQEKRKYISTKMCPCCKTEEETWRHIFTCTNVTRREHRWEQLQQLRRNIDGIKTPFEVRDAILLGIHNWIDGRKQFTEFDTVDWEDTVTNAVRYQNHIGWGNLMRGRMALCWNKAVSDAIKYEVEDIRGKPKDVMQWSTKMVGCILRFGLSLWKERNDMVHGRNRAEQIARRRQAAKRNVKLLYRARSKLRAADRRRLCKDRLKDKLKASTATMEAWCCHMEVALEAVEKDLRRDIESGAQRTISEWLAGHVEGGQPGVDQA